MILPFALLLTVATAAAQGPPGHGDGDRAGAWVSTATFSFAALGWAGLGWALLRPPRDRRAPRPLPGRAPRYGPGLHPADGPPDAVLRALCAEHRVLLVGPLPAGVDPAALPAGVVFPLGDGPVPLGALLDAAAALHGLGPPLAVLQNGPLVDVSGAPVIDLGVFALRRLRLPLVRLGGLHTPSHSAGAASGDREPAPTRPP
ncbi:MAG: hypothetical protein JNM72_13150 [Deltaproteobacteria bacterium]|jgi:hypothetical protein|nr:hypothetical protein [Deltaproteobacteria bacterium]